MEKQETNYNLIDWYAVRISQSDAADILLGTGTLLIRKRDKKVWLLTCAHVLKLAIEDTHEFCIEYRCPLAGNQKRHISLYTQKNQVVKADKLQDSDDVMKDFVCLALAWEDWMKKLPDTKFGDPIQDGKLQGFGFPQRTNTDYSPGKSLSNCMGNLKAMVLSSWDPGTKVPLQYEAYSAMGRTEQMMGFSGTGLFDESGRLICMASAPRGNCDEMFEMNAFPTVQLRERWERSEYVDGLENPFPWEYFSMAWYVQDSFKNQELLRFIPGRINLFYLIGGLSGAGVIFFLDHRKEEYTKAFERIDGLFPVRIWERLSIRDDALFSGEIPVGTGMIISMTFRQEDWRIAERILQLPWIQNEWLLLFDVDISPGSSAELIPGNSEKNDMRTVAGRFRFLRNQSYSYYILSSTCFADMSSAESAEKAQNLLREAEQKEDPFQYLLETLERQPFAYQDVLWAGAGKARGALGGAVCRLAIRYGALVGDSLLGQLYSDADSEFLKDVFYNVLDRWEKINFLGQIAFSRGGDSVWNTLMDGDSLDLDLVVLAEKYRALAQGPWTKELFEQNLDGLTPETFRPVLLLLNRLHYTDCDLLLNVLKTWTDNRFYWKARFCSCWGVEQFFKQSENSDLHELDILLNPIDKETSMLDYAALIRRYLFY